MRKRNPPKQEPDPVPEVGEDPPNMVERPEGEVHELDSTAKHELEARERARELDSRERYELGVLNGAPALPHELA